MVVPMPPRGTRDVADDDPLRRLFDVEYRGMVRLAGTILCGDRAAAEEAVQDAFLRVNGSLARIPEEKWGAYLRTAVVNAARAQIRRSRAAKRQPRLVPVAVAGPEDDAIAASAGRELMALVEQLPERQRTCLVLRYFEGLTDPEVAEAVGISVGSAKTHIHRAITTLRTKEIAR